MQFLDILPDIQLGETPVYQLSLDTNSTLYMKTTYVLHDFNTCGISRYTTASVIERRLHTVLLGTFPAMLLMCLSPWDTSPTTCRVGMPWCKHRWLHQALRVVLNWVLPVGREVVIMTNYFFHFFIVLKLYIMVLNYIYICRLSYLQISLL